MMEKFWNWIARANARLVFIASLMGLLAVGGWQIWSAMDAGPILLPQVPPHEGPAPPADLPLLDLIATRQIHELPATVNPFEIPPPPRQPPPPERPPRQPPPRQPPPQQPPPPEQPTQPPEQPTQPPSPEPIRTLRLRYHGFMIRPDGVKMALIEDTQAGTRRFYPLDGHVDDIRIADINMDTLRLALDESTLVPVPHGAEVEFTGFRDPSKGFTWRHQPDKVEP